MGRRDRSAALRDVTNGAIADVLATFANLLEISGERAFRVRAYRRAAETIRSLPEPLSIVRRENRLENIPGVGPGIASALLELIDTGTFAPMLEVERQTPLSLLGLLQLPGLGPKTVGRLYRELGVTDLSTLEIALESGRVATLKGMGSKTEANLLESMAALKRRTGRVRLGVALPAARRLVDQLQALLPEAAVSIAGSTRRMEESVASVDVVVGTRERQRALAALDELPDVERVTVETEGRIFLRSSAGLDAHFHLTTLESFGSVLVQATGPAAHLAELGTVPADRATEAEVYAALGLPLIPPELRQGNGEVARARAGTITPLIEISDIRGDFHAHTTWSDGTCSVSEMAAAAAARGYDFLGISDHSHSLGVAHGLDVTRLRDQRREIEAASATTRVRLFAGAEVEVARDGGLDFDDDTLSQLDVVIASTHVALRQSRADITARLVRTLRNPHVDIIAHPSGRLIEQREGGDFDWDEVFHVAAATGTALEINADPARLDLNAVLARRALDAGCVLAINCDAHHRDGFASLEYGVGTARRAAARPDQVLNCWSLSEVEAWLRAREPS